jgi:cbb3-type cytochrome oxidase maturation protein
VGDALDGRHRHVGQFASGGSQCPAPAAAVNGQMDILYLLVPLSLVFVFIIAVVFWWNLKSGQFEDLEGPGYRILMDDDKAQVEKNSSTVDSDQNAPGDK